MRKLNITIIAGLVVAVIGATLVFAYGRGVDKRIAAGKRLVDVVVATKSIEGGTSATALGSSVTVTKVPAEYVADGALHTLVGLPEMVLRGPVAKGAQLTAGSFGTAESAALVRPSAGNVALAVEVGLSPGVARYVTPGSVVDMFVTFAGASSSSGGAVVGARGTDQRTKLFASGVRVLSVSVAPPVQVADGTQAAPADQPTSTVIAVIDVSPTTAEQIVNAATLGKLYLALSTAGAQHRTPTGVTPAEVINANR